MWRSFHVLTVAAAAILAAGCGSLLTTTDGSGAHYAVLRGTVTRAGGAPVANASIGVTCVGTTNEPFGLTADADANGRFQTNVNAPSLFPPLTGPSYVCRVLTPYLGVPVAQKSISITVSRDSRSRPVTEVDLVVP